MNTDREKQQQLSEIGARFAEGELYDRVCPFCGQSALTLSFTRIRPRFYGVFVVCGNCGTGHHITLIDKPAGFRDDLVLPEFQKLEDEAAMRIKD